MFSSGIIWNFVINMINRIIKIIPPTGLNWRAADIRINTIPKYIGFLEYLKMPVTTSDDAFSIAIGFTVVCCFLKEDTAEIKIDSPIRSENKLNMLNSPLENAGNNDFVK